jgi:hypothetical protein
MLSVASILAVALSLSSLEDYRYTTPACSSNQIAGIGMGAAADYTLVRAEDVAFLREAYAERTRGTMFVALGDGTNALDRPILARPSEHKWPTNTIVGSKIFEDGPFGTSFALSYTTNEMPYCQIAYRAGSFVRPDFRFATQVNFVPVENFPDGTWGEFRAMSADAVARGMVVATNEIPTMWRNSPYAVGTNRICSLYAGLPLFDVGAQELWYDALGSRRYTVYVEKSQTTQPRYTLATNVVDQYVYIYKTAYDGFPVVTSSYDTVVIGGWSSAFTESRELGIVNEYSCKQDSQQGPWPLQVLGNYEAYVSSRTLSAVSNTFVWLESPVETNAQDGVEVLQAVLSIWLNHAVTRELTWGNPSLPRDDEGYFRSERTNIVSRAVMRLPVAVELDKSVGTSWSMHWYYKLDAPMAYIQSRALALFGDVDEHWPAEPAMVEDWEIAKSGKSGGSAYGRTSVTVTTTFQMRPFMVFRRTYNARVLNP